MVLTGPGLSSCLGGYRFVKEFIFPGAKMF
jgi:hypothetical protein